jgi:hypothetical protein
MMELDKTVQELGAIAKHWIGEALKVGQSNTFGDHTASGIAYEMLKEMEVLDR